MQGAPMHSYDYASRHGVEPISWDRFAALARTLAEMLAGAGAECIVGVARAGLFPATAVACALRLDLYPVRITRRENDEVKHAHPVWKVDMSADVAGKVVAVIDEIADTGETLELVAARALERGAVRVVTACLVSHTWASPAPDVVALFTDALVLFPWDREVYAHGAWNIHPSLPTRSSSNGKPRDLALNRRRVDQGVPHRL